MGIGLTKYGTNRHEDSYIVTRYNDRKPRQQLQSNNSSSRKAEDNSRTERERASMMKFQDAGGEESIRLSKDGSDHKTPIAIAENGMIDMNWTRDPETSAGRSA